MPGAIDRIQSATSLKQALLDVDRVAVSDIIGQCGQDLPVLELVEALVVPVLDRIGHGWDQGQVSLAQVYMSGRICEELLDTLLLQKGSGRLDAGGIAIAVLDDQHKLGLRIVYSLLRSVGFPLLNYGCLKLEPLLERICQDKIRVLLLSSLMLPSALRIKDLVARLGDMESPPRVIVGGAPFRFDPALWQEVGADAFGYSAADAAGLVQRFLEESK